MAIYKPPYQYFCLLIIQYVLFQLKRNVIFSLQISKLTVQILYLICLLLIFPSSAKEGMFLATDSDRKKPKCLNIKDRKMSFHNQVVKEQKLEKLSGLRKKLLPVQSTVVSMMDVEDNYNDDGRIETVQKQGLNQFISQNFVGVGQNNQPSSSFFNQNMQHQQQIFQPNLPPPYNYFNQAQPQSQQIIRPIKYFSDDQNNSNFGGIYSNSNIINIPISSLGLSQQYNHGNTAFANPLNPLQPNNVPNLFQLQPHQNIFIEGNVHSANLAQNNVSAYKNSANSHPQQRKPQTPSKISLFQDLRCKPPLPLPPTSTSYSSNKKKDPIKNANKEQCQIRNYNGNKNGANSKQPVLQQNNQYESPFKKHKKVSQVKQPRHDEPFLSNNIKFNRNDLDYEHNPLNQPLPFQKSHLIISSCEPLTDPIYKKYKNYIVYATKLGKGAFSTVHLGYNTQSKQKVAVKELLTKDLDYNQIACLKRIDSKHVIKLYANFEIGENSYLVMELAEENLRIFMERINKQLASTPKQLLLLKVSCIQMLIQSLNVLFEKGLLHRDLKFQNIVVKNGILKLCDFGLARVLDYKLQLQSRRCGTPYTMAPQVFFHQGSSKHTYTFKADIYSMCVIIHELLYGIHPFEFDMDRLKTMQRVNITRRHEQLKKNLGSDSGSIDWIKQIVDGGIRKLQSRLDWQGVRRIYNDSKKIELITKKQKPPQPQSPQAHQQHQQPNKNSFISSNNKKQQNNEPQSPRSPRSPQSSFNPKRSNSQSNTRHDHKKQPLPRPSDLNKNRHHNARINLIQQQWDCPQKRLADRLRKRFGNGNNNNNDSNKDNENVARKRSQNNSKQKPSSFAKVKKQNNKLQQLQCIRRVQPKKIFFDQVLINNQPYQRHNQGNSKKRQIFANKNISNSNSNSKFHQPLTFQNNIVINFVKIIAIVIVLAYIWSFWVGCLGEG